jgi:hypothetical protein
MARFAVRCRFRCLGSGFYSFGHSDRYPQMDEPPADNAPLRVAESAAKQPEAAVRFILDYHRIEKICLISHSWGSDAA